MSATPTHPGIPGTAVAQHGASSYGVPAAGGATAPSGYQSPYAPPAAAAARTADTRSAFGNAYDLKSNPYAAATAPTAPAGNTWNSSYVPPASMPTAGPSSAGVPASYNEAADSGSWTPPASTSALGGYGNSGAQPAAATTAGAYRPGSTNRGAASLPGLSPTTAGTAQPLAAGATPAAYAPAAYPSTGMPNLSSTPRTSSANASAYAPSAYGATPYGATTPPAAGTQYR
ncbi:MAG: hypothetical protein AB7F89_03525 [Pirellulaceae bacterium]